MEATRISGRVHAEIRVLKEIEKTLHRPFVFGGKIFDREFMHAQLKRRRVQILNQFPELGASHELNVFISLAGELSTVENLPRKETEL